MWLQVIYSMCILSEIGENCHLLLLTLVRTERGYPKLVSLPSPISFSCNASIYVMPKLVYFFVSNFNVFAFVGFVSLTICRPARFL